MKVSLLSPNLSANCLGRAAVLARVLERRYEVEIVGPTFGEGIWPPVADEGLAIRAVPIGGSPAAAAGLAQLLPLIDGEVVFASKPLLASLGVGIAKKLLAGRPLVLDIDDWERGFSHNALAGMSAVARLRYLASSSWRPHFNHSYWNQLLCEALVGMCDGLTVSNRFLARRFGGVVVWHGRDTTRFAPGIFDKAAVRSSLDLPTETPLAIYLGTLRPYKGAEDLVQAIARLSASRVGLAIVGIGDDPYSRRVAGLAREVLGPRFFGFGMQPFSRVPEFLSAADVVVIPQRGGPATIGQIPAKLFDAMAMGIPVVSTAVSDIPEILEECGWVVRPGSVGELAEAIDAVIGDPELAGDRARAARLRCEERFSWDAMERDLLPIFEPFEASRG